MKKLIILAVASISIALAVDAAATNYVFTADGRHDATSPRALPDNGRDFTTGAVVSNLQAQSSATLVGCGWYRVVMPAIELGMLQYPVVEGYTFDTTNGTATAKVTIKDGAPVKRYTQYRVIGLLMQMGKWETVKAYLVQAGLYDLFMGAQYLATDDPVFFGALKEMAKLLGLTQCELNQLLEKCIDPED